MNLKAMAVATALLASAAASAAPSAQVIEANVRQCVAFGYTRACCVASYTATPAGAMSNRMRHQQLAACSGIAPRR